MHPGREPMVAEAQGGGRLQSGGEERCDLTVTFLFGPWDGAAYIQGGSLLIRKHPHRHSRGAFPSMVNRNPITLRMTIDHHKAQGTTSWCSIAGTRAIYV